MRLFWKYSCTYLLARACIVVISVLDVKFKYIYFIFLKSSPACIRVVVQIRSYLTRHILAKHMAKILWIPCCLFCSHSIIFWVKKLPLDPPQVRCYCQTFFVSRKIFFSGMKKKSLTYTWYDDTYIVLTWCSDVSLDRHSNLST